MARRRRSRWEVIDEDEEVVEDEYEVVDEEYEVVGDEYEVVGEDEEVVAKPRGDPILEYAYGLTDTMPRGLGIWRFPWLLVEFRKAAALGRVEEAKRWADLIFAFCPAKPHECPIYALRTTCPFGMLERCRPRALSRARPRKVRGWVRGER